MDLALWQIIALVVLAFYAQYDGLHALTGIVKPVVIGAIVGLIMGDLKTGLVVGGTINLMSLGVGNFGGASVPDYMSATMLGTIFSITSGQGPEFGVAIAVPIGVLLVQLDILARFANVYFQKVADNAYLKKNYGKITIINFMGIFSWGLSRVVPIFIGITLGPDVVQSIVNVMPVVLLSGMKTAGGLLPALGLAILLRYMPLGANFSYAIAGFVLAAYLKLPILAISLIGLAAALLTFRQLEQSAKLATVLENMNFKNTTSNKLLTGVAAKGDEIDGDE